MNRKLEDELLLMDFVLGRCDASAGEAVRRRLAQDEAFGKHHDDIARTVSAVACLPQIEAPEDLVQATLARIRQRRLTETLLAHEQATSPARGRMFSLREASAVAAVLALMACVLVPSFRQAGRLATTGQCAARVGRIGQAMMLYAQDHNGLLPRTESEAGQWLPSDYRASVSNSQSLFNLLQGRYLNAPMFQCPAVAGGGGPFFAVQAGMTDFPKSKFISYSYQHALCNGGIHPADEALWPVADSMAILADATPMFPGGRFDRERLGVLTSDNHNQTGQNVLYLDMHVEWSKTALAGVMGDNIYLAEGVSYYRGDERPTSPIDSFLLPAYSRLH